MRTPRVYLPEATASGQRLALPEAQARHLRKVLRLGPGDAVEVFPGTGGHFTARLAEAGLVELEEPAVGEAESPLGTVLWAGLSKGDKLEWVVQKATELGVTEIRPVHTARSVRRLDPQRAAKNLRRWQEIAAGACEQCGRDVLPAIATVADLDAALAEAGQTAGGLHGLVLAEDGTSEPPGPPPGAPWHLLIGPEGGLNDDELAAAEAVGFHRTALGPRTLRTETAALGALAWAQTRFGDWPGGPR